MCHIAKHFVKEGGDEIGGAVVDILGELAASRELSIPIDTGIPHRVPVRPRFDACAKLARERRHRLVETTAIQRGAERWRP